ncbi:hypothetical protein BpHYR1_043376, partial [Brachionus plicatilis]
CQLFFKKYLFFIYWQQINYSGDLITDFEMILVKFKTANSKFKIFEKMNEKSKFCNQAVKLLTRPNNCDIPNLELNQTQSSSSAHTRNPKDVIKQLGQK